MNQELSDSDLLHRIAARDDAALGEFYDRHANTLFGLAYRILYDHKEAEDLVQEVLLQIWEKVATFNPEQGRPLAWVIVLTRNKAIDRLRSAQRRARLVEEIEHELCGSTDSSAAALAEPPTTGDEAEIVRSALGRLPEEQRRAIMMAFFGGLSQSEIAAELNEALGTVKARIRRGMLRLRDELGPQLCLSGDEKGGMR
jgi:RNA polymerase sigma-70 factor (ECF subfamily)